MQTKHILKEVKELLKEFEVVSTKADLRAKVKALIPVFLKIRELGTSVITTGENSKLSARDRLLIYFRKYPNKIIGEHELALVAGISEWARRVRELRVQFGWKIVSGVTAAEIYNDEEFSGDEADFSKMGPNDYMLLDTKQDREAAYRWSVANEIRKNDNSVQDKIIEYLRKNVGKEISGEELRYVANGKTEWARRVRELRTEKGWPVTTRNTGRPELPVGIYVLEEDRQTPIHDRKISAKLRTQVLKRDKHSCQKCGWHIDEWNKADARFLEIHHVKHHARGGRTNEKNLITVCNVCHDEIHRLEK